MGNMNRCCSVIPNRMVHISRLSTASTLRRIKRASDHPLVSCTSKMESVPNQVQLHATFTPSPKQKQWAAVRVLGHSVNNFQTDLRERPQGLAEFFSGLRHLLEVGQEDVELPPRLVDFQLRIKNEEGPGSGWYAMIMFSNGRHKLRGPVSASRCMSCDLDCPLLVGCVGDVPKVRESITTQCDAW